MNLKKVKNVILHFTSYIKIKLQPKDFDYLRFFNIERDKVLTNIGDEYFIDNRLFTNKVCFRLKKESNRVETFEMDGNGMSTGSIFEEIRNGICQIKEIELEYEDGTEDYIIIDLYYDSPESENNFHCESMILENGNLYVRLDKKINEGLSGMECQP